MLPFCAWPENVLAFWTRKSKTRFSHLACIVFTQNIYRNSVELKWREWHFKKYALNWVRYLRIPQTNRPLHVKHSFRIRLIAAGSSDSCHLYFLMGNMCETIKYCIFRHMDGVSSALSFTAISWCASNLLRTQHIKAFTSTIYLIRV